MKSFVFSFGTVELIEGIVIIDSNINYKTFVKEYSEILDQADKTIKKVLKNAFDKGEFTINDSKSEAALLKILEKLEKYDNPSLNFIESLDPSLKKMKPDTDTKAFKMDEISEIEPGIFEEPPILEDTTSMESTSKSLDFRTEEPPEIEEDVLNPIAVPISINSDTPFETLGAADLQEAFDSIDLESPNEEPAVIGMPIEEVPIPDVEAQSKSVASAFLVQMSEEAEFTLNHNAEVKDAEINGKILLKNLSKEDRIWDINLKLDNIKSTTLETDNFHINELNPGQTWELDYKIKDVKELPLLFEEHIDTSPEHSELVHTLIPHQSTLVEFLFHLENKDEHDIIDIKLEKNIPDVFTDLKVLNSIPPNTELNMEDQTIHWKIGKLKPKQKINLKIHGQIIPAQTSSVKAGLTRLSFTKINDFYSDVILEDISSISKNMYYIEKDEQEQFPGQWNCRLIFENRAEFPLLLESAEVYSGNVKSGQKTTVFRAINEIIGASNNQWVSADWSTTSDEIPTFGKIVKFKIIPSISKSFTANVLIEGVELSVLWVDIKKTYSTSEIASYVTTPVTIEIIITNMGAAEISEIKIEEFIPEDFTPPTIKDFELFLDGKKLDLATQKSALKIESVPDLEDPSQPHQLFLDFKDLIDTIGAIKTNSELKIRYATTAVNPPPKKVYSFPMSITCNTTAPGPTLQITPDMIDIAEITVSHRRRKLTVGKSVYPGAAPGEYEIEMLFKNRGNIPIEHVVISDLVPANFEIQDSKPEAQIRKIEAETVLEWTFERIEPGQKIEIVYKITGTGEFSTSDAELFYKV
ncbi:MAG: hypothetical protein ACTSQI_00770 [Candidatus Helarchaeota archaeon]